MGQALKGATTVYKWLPNLKSPPLNLQSYFTLDFWHLKKFFEATGKPICFILVHFKLFCPCKNASSVPESLGIFSTLPVLTSTNDHDVGRGTGLSVRGGWHSVLVGGAGSQSGVVRHGLGGAIVVGIRRGHSVPVHHEAGGACRNIRVIPSESNSRVRIGSTGLRNPKWGIGRCKQRGSYEQTVFFSKKTRYLTLSSNYFGLIYKNLQKVQVWTLFNSQQYEKLC